MCHGDVEICSCVSLPVALSMSRGHQSVGHADNPAGHRKLIIQMKENVDYEIAFQLAMEAIEDLLSEAEVAGIKVDNVRLPMELNDQVP